jgi:DNA polymerase-3 subunit alpha
VIVGHNIEFDLSIVGCEYLRSGMENVLDSARKLCTKEASTDFCAIMKNGKAKWPNLTELHQKLFGTPFEDAHNAAGDVVATTRCFLELVRIGVIGAQQLGISEAEYQAFKEHNTVPFEPENIEFESFEAPKAETVQPQPAPQPAAEKPTTETQPTDGKGDTFTHLHVHSHYSILDGMSKVPDLINKCMANNMHAMALTDHGNMFGIKDLVDTANKVNGAPKKKVKECKEEIEKESDEAKKAELQAKLADLKAKEEAFIPFKPIIGIEAYCAHETRHKKDTRGWHLILLAKNKTGYKNLCKLSSKAFTEGYYYNARIDHELLEQYHDGIICCSACLGGEVPQKIMDGDFEGAEQSVLWFKNLFGDDYYLEMQRHQTNKPNADQSTFVRQQEVNKVLIDFAKKHNIKLIATNDVHFVEEEHGEAHDRLICLSTGKDFNDPDRMHYTKQEWLKTPEEMAAIFADIPEALANTQEIADKVEVYSIDSDPIMPKFPIPPDFGTEEQYRKEISEQALFDEFTQNEKHEVVLSQEDAEKKIKKLGGYDKLYRIKLEADYLAKLTWEGAEKRYGKNLTTEQRERITFELHIMKTMGFPGYFLIVQDYIRAAREELGVSVGPGRGSAAGSVVAYCLRITDLDPLEYDLLFERFLNPDRISLPDIDVDFDDEGRGKVLDWVTQKYGSEKVAHIITYGTMATKSSLADVCRVQGISVAASNKIKKFVPDRDFEELQVKNVEGSLPKKMPKVNLKNCYKYIPELKQILGGNRIGDDDIDSYIESLPSVLTYAEELEDTNRQIGIHACGVIIGADDLTNFAPVCTVKDRKSGQDVVVTQYDGHVVESVGLIKMDFLGLSTLSLIKEAIANVKKTRGIDVDIDGIPMDDKLTFKLYSEGRTIGTFQFESPGMQKYLRELQPSQITDLIAMNALYRPGPMDYIPQFIRRKQGLEPITYDIPVMETYLKDTYGVTVYQEQVMLLSRLLAGFTRGEADTLRKAMGKKIAAMLAMLKPKFIEGGKKNGHDETILLKIWADWEKFASYAFNKSHAACYAWVAYQTGYLKAHYPAEYMAANLTQSKDSITDVQKFMEECKAMKIPVKGPDINESDLNFTANKKGEIRFGLGGIKGVGSSAVEIIVNERQKNGKFTDIFNFFERISLTTCNAKTIQSLAIAGAFDSLDVKREIFMGESSDKDRFLDELLKYGNAYQSDKQNNTNTLFGSMSEAIAIPRPRIPDVPEIPLLEKLNMEKDVVGIYLSAHPLDPFKFDLENFCTVSPKELENLAQFENRDVSFGGLVTDVYDGLTKKGRPFMTFFIEDYNGAFKVALFDKDYEAYSKLIKKNSSLFIKARVEERRFADKDGNRPLELHLTSIKLLSNIRDEFIKKLTINIKLQDLNKVNIDLLKNALSTKGDIALYFMVLDTETGLTLNLLSHNMSVKITDELVDFLENNSETVSYTLNNGQWKPRKKKEEPQSDSDNFDNGEMPNDMIDGADD